MFFISIFKRENRRSGRDRRKSKNPRTTAQDKRSLPDRRCSEDRRGDLGRRSGMYYKLPDNRKDLVDTIVGILEREDMKMT